MTGYAAIGLLGAMLFIGGSNSCSEDLSMIPERRGCCSHHGGVCGCEKGRALCCDGQLSPTCGCD